MNCLIAAWNEHLLLEMPYCTYVRRVADDPHRLNNGRTRHGHIDIGAESKTEY